MQKTIVVPILLSLFLLSLFLQSNLPIHWNMLYILEAGQRLLAGGTLLQDAFDPNPPLIFYVSKWINQLAQTTHLSNVWVWRAVTYLSIGYSLCISGVLLPEKQRSLILITLAFCFLILPAQAFAEREHWMITLTMPYFFLLYQRAEHHDVSPFMRMSISAIAGFACCLKPYFFMSILCAELLFIYWEKNWRSLFRLETSVLFITTVTYLLFVMIAVPDYYQQILPKVMRWYAFNNRPLFATTQVAFLSISTLVFFCALSYPRLSRMEVLLLAVALGCALAFVLQGKAWFYHAVPLLTLTTLITALYIHDHLRAWWLLLCAQCIFVLMPMALTYGTQLACYRLHQCPYQPLVNVVHAQQAQDTPIYFFTTLMSESIPVVYYSSAQLASRFPFMWPLSGIINREQTIGQCDNQCQQDKHEFREFITTDLQRYQPRLVFVDSRPQKAYLSTPFDYLTFMKQSSVFSALWKNYLYLYTVNHYAIYRRA
jgi:hypothetical protein